MEYYTHRSGRTARAGKKGMSLALIDPREKAQITELENKLRVSFSEYRR
jgi:ATP-dependent RNA helicase DeaD